MRVLDLTRGDREPFVPALEETIGERLRLVDGGDAGQAHLLDQPILRGLVGALHPALGLRVAARMSSTRSRSATRPNSVKPSPPCASFGVDTLTRKSRADQNRRPAARRA